MKNKLAESIEGLKVFLDAVDIDPDRKEEIYKVINNIENLTLDMKEIQVKTEEELKESIQKCRFYEASIDALPNPVFIKNAQGEFVYFNEAYQEYFDMERDFYLNKTVLDLEFLSLEERERYHLEDLQLISQGNVKHYESEFELADKEIGQSLYWSKGFETVQGADRGLVGEIVDITAQKKLQEKIALNAQQLKDANFKIEKMMYQDCLTGLYNRRAMEDNIPKLEESVKENGAKISLVMADLDDFKLVNDTFGHSVGDHVLEIFAKILEECNRKEDLLVRYGGEEFLVILFDTTLKDAGIVAERIRRSTEEALELPDGRMNTVSIGVSQILPNEPFMHALDRADNALYRAKKSGKNKVVM